MIPNEVKKLKQWSFSYSLDELKRPTHSDYTPNGGLSLTEAINKAKDDRHIGMYVTEQDPYILMDLDHIENPDDPFTELPFSLAQLLQTSDTYSETSPSGKGIRVLFKLPSAEDKQKVQGSTFYVREGENLRDAQINLGAPWMTITMKPTPYSTETVAEITLEELGEIFDIKMRGKRLPQVKSAQVEIPTISDIRQALSSLPVDQNPRVQRAYKKVFGHTYQHYDYWLKVLMALHNFSTLEPLAGMECLKMAIEWSATDTEVFKSEEDVIARWESFRDKEEEISYKTIFGLYYSSALRWPIPRKQKKEEAERGLPKLPLNSEYKNFRALMEFYNIKIYRDEVDVNILYLSSDQDVVDKYFKHSYRVEEHYGIYYGPFSPDVLTSSIYIMCQDLGFVGIGSGQVNTFVSVFLAKTRLTINFIRKYFDTPFAELPAEYQENAHTYDTTTMDKLFSCLDIDYMTENPVTEIQLYKRYYEAWWMGLIRNLYYQDQIHTNNCVLLLTGREQIRKTSHFKYLLPSFLRGQVAFTTHGFTNEASVRDVCKLSATNLMIVWDEIEQYLDSKTESNFKKIIDNNEQKFIDKYQVVPMTIRPIAIYGGTSNMREFKLGDAGSRRLFHIPVKWVDTDAVMRINWHRLVNDVKTKVDKAMAEGNVPWLLNENELEQQVYLHKGIRSLSVIDITLEEMFDSDAVLDAGYNAIPGVSTLQGKNEHRTLTTKDVMDLFVRYGIHTQGISRAALVQSLRRLCGNYTRSRRATVNIDTPKCAINKGLATQGPHKRWIMPPMRPNAYENLYSVFNKEG